MIMNTDQILNNQIQVKRTLLGLVTKLGQARSWCLVLFLREFLHNFSSYCAPINISLETQF